MCKHKLRQAINITASLTAIVMVATGLLLKYVMPPGSRGGRGLELWGLGRHDWGDWHYICSLVLAGLLLIHLLFFRRRATPPKAATSPAAFSADTGASCPVTRRYGIVLLAAAAALILGFLWIASLNLTRSAAGTHSDQCTGERRRAASQPTGASVEKTTVTR